MLDLMVIVNCGLWACCQRNTAAVTDRIRLHICSVLKIYLNLQLRGFPSCLSAGCQQCLGEAAATDLDLQQLLWGQSCRWWKCFGADRRRWTGERARNPFRDVNKIKEPDMKHEVHYKGNVNLSPAPFIIKNSEPSLGGSETPANLWGQLPQSNRRIQVLLMDERGR